MVLGFRKTAATATTEPVATDAEAAAAAHPAGHTVNDGLESPADEYNADAAEAVRASGVDPDAAVNQLKKFEKLHKWDLYLPQEKLDQVHGVLESGDIEKEIAVEHALLEEDSPYPEVRSAVRNYDENDVAPSPANTIRAWTLGLLLTTVACAINMLFSLRDPSVYVTTYVVQLIAYPLGVAWTKFMPSRTFKTFGYEWSLNATPFNMKEHTIIVVMANASFGGGQAYATDILLAQQVFYGQNFGWGFQLLLVITTQMIGFGMAGLVRRFLVWPAAMVWPSTLVNTTLFYTLHDHRKSDPAETNGWSIGRYRYFLYVFAGAFCWYWFPGWIAQFLTFFVFVTWAAPQNPIVNQIFGGHTGLGLIPITFDWTIISAYINSPLIYPWFAIANMVGGVIIFFLITALGVHYTGAFYSDYLPMQDSRSYDNTGHKYNVSRIMNPDLTLNVAAYEAYSPIFLSTNFAICYGIAFATISSLLVHTALYNGKEVWARYKLARNQDADVHLKMMKKYKDSPDWWYLALYVVIFALSLVTCLVWDTHFTWWAFIICMIIPCIFIIPVGMVYAVTNWQIGLNVITEFIIGYMQPGRPLAMMMFKTYGYIAMSQALYFVQDLKMGHYMKVPPRVMFSAQFIATLWSSIVQLAVFNWALGSIEGICDADQPNRYTCPNASVFYTASVVWGAIGPGRIFSPGAVYGVLQWYWLLGAALPVVTYLLARKWPRSTWRYVMTPLMFGGTGMIPPATVYIYLCWGVVGFVFNKFIRGRYFGWWSQYNYVTSAALDTGLFAGTVIIFFALQLPQVNPPQWWGNVDVFDTMDMTDTAVRVKLPKGETFGPPAGSWH